MSKYEICTKNVFVTQTLFQIYTWFVFATKTNNMIFCAVFEICSFIVTRY